MPDSAPPQFFGVVPVVVSSSSRRSRAAWEPAEGDEVSSSPSRRRRGGTGRILRGRTDGPRARDVPRGTPSCIVCQRAVHYLDENLLVKILDERADRSVNDPANYGRIEAIVEDEVSKVCSARASSWTRSCATDARRHAREVRGCAGPGVVRQELAGRRLEHELADMRQETQAAQGVSGSRRGSTCAQLDHLEQEVSWRSSDRR